MSGIRRARGRKETAPMGPAPLEPVLTVEALGRTWDFYDLDALPPRAEADTWRAYVEAAEGDEDLARLLDAMAKAGAWVALAAPGSLEVLADGDVQPDLLERIRASKRELLGYLEREARMHEALAPAIYAALGVEMKGGEA